MTTLSLARRGFMPLALALLAAPQLSAQAKMDIGQRLRVTVAHVVYAPGTPFVIARPGPRIVGTVTVADQTSIGIRREDGVTVMLPKDAIDTIEIPSEPSKRKQGALWGLAVGAGLGIATATAFCRQECGCDTTAWVINTTVSGLVLGGIGAAIGALSAPGERWYPVPLDALPGGAATP